MTPYAHKLLIRAEGIWHNLGLALAGKDFSEHDGATSIVLTFNSITPTQAELLVSQMGVAFRRARIHWKECDGSISVCVEIPPT